MPLTVSAVIPAYNSGKTLKRAIDSVLRQSVETSVIVVDDGSTDNTQAVLATYGSRITSVRQANGGAGAARSAGTRLAKTDLIAYLDADDVWHDDKLRRQVGLFGDPEIGLASAAGQWVDESGEVIHVSRPALHGYVTRDLLLRNPIVTSSVVVRRSHVERMSALFRPELFPVEDWEVWIRLSSLCKVSVSPEILVDYHISAGSGTRARDPEHFRELFQAMFRQLSTEPRLAPLVAANQRRISANIHFMTGYMHYEKGSYGSFWKDVARSVALAPASHPWRDTLTMLFLPRSVRERLRRFVARLGRRDDSSRLV